MYARQIEGLDEPLTFGVSGKLIMNVLVMYDRQTGSLWSQILGQAVEGELAGTQLTPLPALQTTWEAWRALHPETLALNKGYPGARDPYDSYYRDSRAGVLGETRADNRLPRKELGLGLIIAGQPAFYPFSRLSAEGVVNDRVGDHPLLVVFRPEATTGLAFDPSVDGQVLTFSQETGDNGDLVLVDDQTASRWNSWTGTALAGPLAGQALARVPATTSFWFGWKDWHPDTHLYGDLDR